MAAESYTDDTYTLEELVITNYKGKSFDLTPSVVAFNIEESIFDSFIKGSMVLEDSIGFQSNLPLIGNEEITISYRRRDNSSEAVIRRFTIYSIDNISKSEGKKTIGVSFCSNEMIRAQARRLSRAYSLKSSRQIIDDIYKKFLQEDVVSKRKTISYDNFTGVYDHVFPRVTPLEAIQTVCGMTEHISAKRSFVLFYETIDGFNVTNIESLFEEDPAFEFNSTVNIQPVDDSGYPNRQIVRNWSVMKTGDQLDLLEQGAWATRMISYDPLAKKHMLEDTDLLDNFDDYMHVGNAPLINRDFEYNHPSQGAKFFTTKSLRKDSSYYRQNSSIENSVKPERVYTHKRALLSHFNSLIIKADVTGGVYLKAGDKIKMNLPLHSASGSSGEDPVYSGEYIVTKVIHSFTMNKIKTEIICQKDSLPSELQ